MWKHTVLEHLWSLLLFQELRTSTAGTELLGNRKWLRATWDGVLPLLLVLVPANAYSGTWWLMMTKILGSLRPKGKLGLSSGLLVLALLSPGYYQGISEGRQWEVGGGHKPAQMETISLPLSSFQRKIKIKLKSIMKCFYFFLNLFVLHPYFGSRDDRRGSLWDKDPASLS